MMRYRIPTVLPLLLLLSGCFCSQYRDTAYFDLTPAKAAAAVPVEIAVLQNRSGAGSRFQYRAAGGRILADPDRKWIMPPGALVSRALRSALTPAKSDTADSGILVSGEILFFETDLETRKFHLQAQLRITRRDGKTRDLNCDIEIPLTGDAPEHTVRAADQAVNELAEQLSKAL